MTTPDVTVDKYIKMKNFDVQDPVGETTEIKVRFLEYPGEQVFQHWIGPDQQHVRPYNCPSRRAGCPACAERQILKLKGEDHRTLHRISKKNFANVLELSHEDPKLKVFAFGPQIFSAIETLTTRKGKEDPTSYDITVVKRKTGPEKFNIEYATFFEEVRPLTDVEKALAENSFDLTAETTDATNEVIAAAIKGQITPRYVDPETAKKVVEALKKHNLELKDVDLANESSIPFERAEEILKELA
jgi:hypothetical protein